MSSLNQGSTTESIISSPPAPRERRPSVSKNGLCILQAALGLIDSSGQVSPPIIMTIDFENTYLLTRLECPFDNLHSAGNDANYTLKAALLLAATGSDNQQAVDQLTQISIPPMVCYGHEKKSKRQKRWEKSKRFKAKSRSPEEQNQIREQRAAKRDEAESLRLPK
ncbi:hypothetical protein B0I35DRAFT_460660 [Stachybotrys elegans]|uniref:Uncharacterized protein n=1 Tax=Stachybotrys elegans TaxID=80388 RepID=A0A8K0SR30_9HYPO|nr:hypothetical protein B0I35DRAFT_460660 [Stachybotrys elegans]